MYFGYAGSSLLNAGFFYFQFSDFSFQWLLLLQSTGFTADRLQQLCGLRICGTSIQLPSGMWNLPRPGLNSTLHGTDILNYWINREALQTFLYQLRADLLAEMFPQLYLLREYLFVISFMKFNFTIYRILHQKFLLILAIFKYSITSFRPLQFCNGNP